jgi:ribonucleoside-diphosphate reductase alpha chain
MFVVKRNQKEEPVSFDKIQRRLSHMSQREPALSGINVAQLTQSVIAGLTNRIQTYQIDAYSAHLAASLGIHHIDYLALAARIVVHNHHKNTLTSFKDKMTKAYLRSMLDERFYKFIVKHQEEIEKRIDHNRDFLIDYFGFKTLEYGYLLKVDGVVIERPQDLFMREAIFLHFPRKDVPKKELVVCLERIFETYDLLSQKYFTHASPTMFNAGMVQPGCLSCFLLDTEDSIDGIYGTLTSCAHISKYSGGIAVPFSSVRSKGSYIKGTNGISSGIIPFLRVYNETARAVNQGSKRNGSIAIYLEMHHPDILEFLDLRRQGGDENKRCYDLFPALWVSDLFMKRVETGGMWSLFDPSLYPTLATTFGEAYETYYHTLEQEHKWSAQLPAREIWKHVFLSQRESGMPYILYKDHVNRVNNQCNIGMIKSSNLCAEIVEVSDYEKKEYACCTLASIALPMFVEDTADPPHHDFPKQPVFNFTKLKHVVGIVVRNLNQVIDRNYYPVPETERSNKAHRPLGIGVQGLFDVYQKFKFPYTSADAKELNRKIFECMYYAAVSASSALARELYQSMKKKTPDLPKTAGAYSSFEGSPLSKGIFNFELYGKTTSDLLHQYDWETLREHVRLFGTRNSLLLCCMPTASTSQILGNTESIEIATANMYSRRVLSGEYLVVNKFLFQELSELGWWTPQMEDYLKRYDGSVQQIEGLPQEFKDRYRTVWEIKQKDVIDQSADRQIFVDQSQSLNLHISDLTFDKFNSVHFYGWRKQLKTGCYYMRSCPAVMPDKFTLSDTAETMQFGQYIPPPRVVIGVDEGCLVCGS